MELLQNNNGPTDQIDQNKLFEQFYNDDSLDPTTVGKTEEAPHQRQRLLKSPKEPAGQPAPQSSSGSGEAERKKLWPNSPFSA